MYKFLVLQKRDLINIIKNPTLLISNTGFVFVLILILGFLNRDNYGNAGIDNNNRGKVMFVEEIGCCGAYCRICQVFYKYGKYKRKRMNESTF